MNQIVLYGAGSMGKKNLEFFKSNKIDNKIIAFCDKNYKLIKSIGGIPVYSYEEVKNMNADFIISILEEKDIIENQLLEDGVSYFQDMESWMHSYYKDPVERDRNIISYYHINNSYYEDVETKKEIDKFWSDNSPFYRMFRELNLENVIELACGKGRHVPMYINKANHITLVDILSQNIEYCKKRFCDNKKISFYCNDGYDLRDLPTESYSALFTYDAMVHFEMLDIYSYLRDIYRILKPGGAALFHHSNNSKDYRENFLTNKNNRNFMSKEIFAYMAYKIGFEIERQQVIDWGENENYSTNIDCISLVKKPYN